MIWQGKRGLNFFFNPFLYDEYSIVGIGLKLLNWENILDHFQRKFVSTKTKLSSNLTQKYGNFKIVLHKHNPHFKFSLVHITKEY